MHKNADKALIIFATYATAGLLGAYAAFYQYMVLTISGVFSVGAAVMGLMIGMHYLGMSAPPLFIGMISIRYGKKKLMLASYSLIIVGTLLVAMIHNITALIVSVFIIGAGFSVSEATVSAVLSDEFPKFSRRHLSFSQVLFSLGALVSPQIAAVLLRNGLHYTQMYLGIAALYMIFMVVFAFTRHQNDKGAADVIQTNPFRLLGNRTLLFLGLGICTYVGLETTIAGFTDNYYKIMTLTPEYSALALSLFWGAMIPSRFLAGLLKTETRKIFAALSALTFIATLAAMIIPDPIGKLVCFALAGFGCGPLWPLMMHTAAQRSLGASSSVLGLMMTFSGLGGAGLPFAAGLFVGSSNPSSAYFLSAIAVVVMATLYFLAWRTTKKHYNHRKM